jgi:hypothetical protein
MLFLKNEGTSLGVVDWIAQTDQENPSADCDLLAEAADAVWQAITQRDIPYSEAIREVERRVLEAAITLGGYA